MCANTHEVSQLIQARIKRTFPSFMQVLHFNNQINIYILSPNYIVNFVVTQPARKNDVHFHVYCTIIIKKCSNSNVDHRRTKKSMECIFLYFFFFIWKKNKIKIQRIKQRNFIPPEKAINCSNYVHNLGHISIVHVCIILSKLFSESYVNYR